MFEGRVVERLGVVTESGMRGDEGEAKGVEGVDQEVNDDEPGGGGQSAEVVGGHRLRAVGAGLAFRGLGEHLEEKPFVEWGALPVGGDPLHGSDRRSCDI